MIQYIDSLLKGLLITQVAGLTAQRVGFRPPDADWRGGLGNNPGVSVNAYLVDITEDRALRTNAVHREIRDSVTFDTRAPERIRLHYLLSAWNSAKESPQVRATEQEHAMLGNVVGVLLRSAPINATRILSAADLATFPEVLKDADLPTRVVPQDGFPRLAEFWGTMGRPQALKPVVYLTVTAPVVYPETEAGGIVQTILGDIGRSARRGAPLAVIERVLVVGGTVLNGVGANAAAPVPVAGARVDLLAPTGTRRATATTDPDGHFEFPGLAPGSYRFAYSNGALPATVSPLLTLPQASGEIELVFS